MDKQNMGYDQQGYAAQYGHGQGQPPPQQQHLNQVVITQPQTTYTVATVAPRWSWCSMITAAISYFCCQPFGLIAVIMALVSYSDHKVKEFDRSRNKRNCAYGFGIAAIVIGSIMYVGFIIGYSVIIAAATRGRSYYG